jgi:hypothetical protein
MILGMISIRIRRIEIQKLKGVRSKSKMVVLDTNRNNQIVLAIIILLIVLIAIMISAGVKVYLEQRKAT